MTELSIEWRGEILSDIGYGIQARRIIKPLIEAGVDVKVIPAESYIPDHRKITDQYWLSLIEESKQKPDAPIRVCYEVPTVSQYRPGAFNIAYAMWETSKYPREWVPQINRSSLFFTGCPALNNSAKRADVKVPCVPIVPPVDTDLWCPEGDKLGVDGVKDKDIVFMINANWIPRKNFEDLLAGLCVAFHNVPDVVLVIKTWGGDNSANFRQTVWNNIKSKLNLMVHINRPRVMLIADILPEEQIIKLMRRADVYTTVSHGEGLDLPAIQALSLGKILVSTNYLGHEFYMTPANSIAVKYSMMPVVDAKAAHYAPDQMWSRPDLGHYIECLQKAYRLCRSKGEDWKKMTTNARETAIEKFHYSVTTKQLIDTLGRIQPKPQPLGAP